MERMTFRREIARWILAYGCSLMALVIILYMMKGFLQEELLTVIGLTTPVSAAYLGSLFRFLGSLPETVPFTVPQEPYSPIFTSVTKAAIHFHFGTIAFLLVAKAWFNWISFEDLKLIFAFVETAYAAFAGYLISALFKVEEKP